LKDKHAFTDLYLLDEISMVSLSDLASLSERMSLVFDNREAFGGKHIVVCGDFAQLPPPGAYAAPLYSNKPTLSSTKSGQMHVMGKALWYQFTTVVFLTENMR
jgi:hypothetical protein